ncbi:MAG: DNA polymerase elongation subunit, family B [halophilic archaeon J07HX64]|jgi:DNA polymerase elongation subunit (family B)|nr:MAG: DNA polymerase elongation subunit, family B [halophilic archaeon J07HX64]
MQVDYTVEGRGDDEYPVVHVFGRTADGDPVHARVLEFKPYFYAPVEEATEQRLRQYDRITGWEQADASGDPYESIRGERLMKIFGQTPRDVGQLRDDFDHFEADILFPNRLLIDKDITSGIRLPVRTVETGTDRQTLRVHHEELDPVEVDATPRVNTFDIEVDDRSGFPEDGEERIICITSHDSVRDEYVLWLYDPPEGTDPPAELTDYTPIQAREDTVDSVDRADLDTDIRVFDTEEAMLDAFVGYIEQTDPDVATGWNFTDFDAPYLLDRLEELNPDTDHSLGIDRLSRVDEVWRSDWQGPNVKGRVMFDLLYAYQRTKFTELDSYRLEDVGQRELGIGKERYAGDIGDLWEENPERLLEYNLRDVELCVELDDEQNIIPFWNEVRQFVGCKLEDATTPGDAVDMYVLHKLHDKFALPSKGRQASEDYEGGAVFDPITGVRENVSVLDLKSLYPMCMVTINASPETKVDPETYDGETYTAPNETHFRKEPDGAIREMVDELLTEREDKKALRSDHDPDSPEYEQYDRQQQAVKVIMNCFTPDTDVLTPDGVRNIRDLAVGDRVYSLDPETMEMEVKPVVETQSYPDYRGDLVDIETRKTDFRVTPNHRMLVRKNETNGITEDSYSFVEAGDLDDATNYELPHDWDGPDGDPVETIDLTDHVDEYEVWVRPSVHGHSFAAELGYRPDTVPKNDLGQEGYVFAPDEFEQHREYIEQVAEKTFVHAEAGRKWIPRTYDGTDFLDLLAWYVTEGNVHTSETKQFGEGTRGSATTVEIAQNAVADGGESHHGSIGDLLDRMGFDYYVDERSYQFTSKLLGDLFEEIAGTDSFTKRIPEFVFGASQPQKRRFLETLIDGDGDRQTNSWRYSTASEQLRDDVLRLCTHLGLTANYQQDSGTWRIYVTEDSKNTLRMHRSGSTSTADDGVYCVTVEDNHTLMAGRNGTFQFVGQSLYGVLGWDRFRLYDRQMGGAVTATGREVIEFTEEVTNELDKEVIYGDSVTGERPVVVRDPDGIVRIYPIERLYQRATQSPAEDTVITVDGMPITGIESSKEYATLEGWDALSVDDDGQSEWSPIEQVVRHETDKPVIKLQHKFGESVTTRDHSYVVESGGELVEAPPNEVESPLRIPDMPETDEIETIDVYEVLNGYTRRYEDGRGSGGVTTKTKRVCADDEAVWFGHEHHRGLDKTVEVQRYIDLDSEDGEALLRLLGAYVPEGSASTVETTDSRFGASIAESRRTWLEQLQDDYHRLFENTSVSIVASDTRDERTVEHPGDDSETALTYDDQTLKLQMMNELAAVFFREFAGQRSRGKKIPSFVFHLPAEKQELFIQMLVEGDGSREFPRYSAEYAERNFDFETTSRELAGGLSVLLTQRGTKHSLKYREEKESYTVRTCDYYDSGREPVLTEVAHDGYVYDLSVRENENFVDAVGGIVLHNTDSVMISMGSDAEKAESIERSFEIEERINEAYDEFAAEELNASEHRFQIEFEKLYRRFFQAGKKKRYAGHIVWKEGKDVDDIDITGFEYKRSDIAPVTKEVQLEVIESIVTGADIADIKQYVTEVIEGFQTGENDPEEIGIPGGIGKRLDNYDTDTAQVRGAKYANRVLGTNFQRGSKPKRLYIDRVHAGFFRRVESENPELRDDPVYQEFKRDPDVICFEYADQLPEEFEIDWEKMLDKTLKGPIERILEALDISWEEVKSGQEQTGLGEFM